MRGGPAPDVHRASVAYALRVWREAEALLATPLLRACQVLAQWLGVGEVEHALLAEREASAGATKVT